MVAKRVADKSTSEDLTDREESRLEPESSDNKSQLDKFKEAARQLETDDDEGRFNENLRKLAKRKPDDKDDK